MSRSSGSQGSPGEGSGLFDSIRAACAKVAERARFVQLDEARLAQLASELPELRLSSDPDPAHHRRGSDAATLAYVLTLDAINFGSGWFPFLRKRPGCSGYFTVALAIAEHFDAHGAWSARELAGIDADLLAGVLDQDPALPEASELLHHFARSLRDLGTHLEGRHGGRFEGLLESAHGSAERLVAELARMPSYRDVARYGGFEVPFYKRAQITVADLRLAFAGEGPGRFRDLDRLTIFADNLVPHVLRLEGVLVYRPDLLARIAAEQLIEAGSPEEVEIRACALHAVERLVGALRRLGRSVGAWELDEWLWRRGQEDWSKAEPRHRTRTLFY